MPKADRGMQHKNHLGVLENCLLIQSISNTGVALSHLEFSINNKLDPLLFLEMKPILLPLFYN